MPDQTEASDLRVLLDQLCVDVNSYFGNVRAGIVSASWDDEFSPSDKDRFWAQLPANLQQDALRLIRRILTVSGQIVIAVRNAPLVSEADQRELMIETKAMRAAVRLRRFSSWPLEVLHDEGTVLGVQPAGQSDDEACSPTDGQRIFSESIEKVAAILDLVAASRGLTSDTSTEAVTTRYRPNTAFIMMWMDNSRPELDDVSDAIKDVFAGFHIRAVRADDIEHEDLVTERILNEIATAEFLFADLTGERPSVYYEVGYAHALRRRVILVRKAGTGLHFDLAGYNCPEYDNLRDLKEILTKRLEHVTNRRSADTEQSSSS